MAMTRSATDDRKSHEAPKIDEVHVLWITAGLGCDGDSVHVRARYYYVARSMIVDLPDVISSGAAARFTNSW